MSFSIDPPSFSQVDEYKTQQLEFTEVSRNKTAKKAAQILINKNLGFILPTAQQRKILLVEFARNNKVLYGKAFDIIRITENVNIDLDCYSSVKNTIKESFKEYFFGLTTAELLVAQNLREQYKFAFVNIKTEDFLELSLAEVFTKAIGIYPTWSIKF
jgi:hypothetical protein